MNDISNIPANDPHADDPVVVVLTRSEAGVVRSVLGTHRKTIARKQRAVERKLDHLGPEFVAEKTALNALHLELTNSAYRKVKRALWGKA